MSIDNEIPKCVICGTNHFSNNSGQYYGTNHEIKGKIYWIGTTCFGNWTCLIANQILTWDKIPNMKDLYRAYQIYCKRHQEGEPWWNGWIYCDSYTKKRHLLDKGISDFMERVLS